MNDVADLENVENVCRLCLSTEEPKSSIFGVQDSAVSLAAKIQACLSIQVSTNDRLSTLICVNCVKNVNQWHNYKEACLRSQDKLNQWLANHLQSSPMVVTIKDEPVDLDFCEDNIEILSEATNGTSPDAVTFEQAENEILNNSRAEKSMDDEAQDTQHSKEPELITPEIITKDVEKDTEKDSEDDSTVSDKDIEIVQIKSEPHDDYDTDCTIEIESVTGSELLLNPLAFTAKDDMVMEADSTQKSNAALNSASKKKVRRGPHTHFRGSRSFKQKCVHCQINLHSKHSYMKHMERFHSENEDVKNSSMTSASHDEEEIEDLEDELISMEKDAPLTQVQQNIISQLKTFSCYSCQQSFTDRRSTLSHIRQHMPDLRPYTCIACLTEFPDRSMYKLHCSVSFECAMKIALVIPKQGVEQYFTCNMCLRPMADRKELLSHLSRHSDKQYEELMSPARSPPKLTPITPLPSPKNDVMEKPPQNFMSIPSPYKNGDPAHNHVCSLCGMIYRYKPNMLKHKQLCMRLSPEVRTSYRCVDCGMTFLVFKKFHTHITVDHKKKEFVCSKCNNKFRSPSDYLAHHESHRTIPKTGQEATNETAKYPQSGQAGTRDLNSVESDVNAGKGRPPQKYSCALCSQEFSTRIELSEHRNLHLKVKIYSCVICRSMFSSAGALEIHMKDHGIEDPNERNANSSCIEYERMNEDSQDRTVANTSTVSDPGLQNFTCGICGKAFSNRANLKRHITNGHSFNCPQCNKTFRAKALYDSHLALEHKSTKTTFRCPKCSKTFVFQANLKLHFENAHGEKSRLRGNQECDICGKTFLEEVSLKIHKGWHNRTNSRMNARLRFSGNNDKDTKDVVQQDIERMKQESSSDTSNLERPARARKSFPNPPPNMPQGNYQCQVCEDKFNEVTELREHLWDVHCARNKQEKSISGDELQCQLCTNIFPDHDTLKIHMQWHKAHPILGDIQKKSFPCDTCGKLYSSKKVLWRHKKLHKSTAITAIKFQSLSKKPTNQYLCTICQKYFSSNQVLQRHKLNIHSKDQVPQQPQSLTNGERRVSGEDPKTKKVKIEEEDKYSVPVSVSPGGRKPVMCHVCKKTFPNMSVLYKHKQLTHKPRVGKPPDKLPSDACIPMLGNDGKVSCNICHKEFPGMSNLRQHFAHKHRNASRFLCQMKGCRMEFPSAIALKNHESTHTNMIFSCKLCDRHVFSRPAITHHMLSVHNTVYEAENNRNFHRETDLGTYTVEGAVGPTCPRCNIKYPNNRAMKIHYFKFHESKE